MKKENKLTLQITNRKHIFRTTFIWAGAYIFAVLFGILSGYGITGIDIVLPLIMIGAAFLMIAISLYKEKRLRSSLLSVQYFWAQWKKKENRFSRAFSILIASLFSLTIVVGEHIDMDEDTFEALAGADILAFLILTVLFSTLCFGLFLYTDQFQAEAGKKEIYERTGILFKFLDCFQKHVFFYSFVLYFLAYLPYYLTFFPGNSGRDTMESLQIILGQIPLSNHQPIFFTFLIALFVWTTGWMGSLTLSLGCFAFFQMISMSLFLAYVTKRIFALQTASVLKLFSVLVFAFHPIVAMYSIYLTKDVLFSECMILLCFCLYDLVKSKGQALESRGFVIRMTVLTVLSALLRNNGLYIAIVLLFILPFVYKRYVKQILFSFGTAVVLLLLWQGPVFQWMGIEKESFAEAASVPLQQIGYVIWEADLSSESSLFSEEDQTFLEKLMPFERVKEVYEPGYTDPYKFDEAFDDEFLNNHVGEFLKVWWHGCLNHFPSYVKAYLMQTAGYWHYGETNTVCTQGVTENSLGIVQKDFFKNTFGFSLEPLFEKLVLAGRKAPIVCILSSMAMQMFMVFLLGVQFIRRGRKELLLFLLPFVILWGTIMIATPAFCLLRYLYPSFLMFPYFLAEFFRRA